ncbi:unnamed protein product [Gulo gulo]|uniref:Uncharacterized protein n=1 Tax=Gulo gulo TaxID=48420 RepID=A0A9X9M1F4_GULGU|nr:unnamed protein product [Gulo gulo]
MRKSRDITTVSACSMWSSSPLSQCRSCTDSSLSRPRRAPRPEKKLLPHLLPRKTVAPKSPVLAQRSPWKPWGSSKALFMMWACTLIRKPSTRFLLSWISPNTPSSSSSRTSGIT